MDRKSKLEKVKTMRERLAVSVGLAAELLEQNDGNVVRAVEAFHRLNVERVARLAGCEASHAEEYYRSHASQKEVDVDEVVKAIRRARCPRTPPSAGRKERAQNWEVKELEYEFHDSCVSRTAFPDEKRIDVFINLYSIFYPDGPTVKISLLDVLNWESSRKFFKRVGGDATRVDAIHYDTRKESTSVDTWLHFEIDHFGRHTVHCRGLRIEPVDPVPFRWIEDAKGTDVEVLRWAWSGKEPFGVVAEVKIFGLAVCRYATGEVYRFACDRDWAPREESPCSSVEVAMDVPEQYRNSTVNWNDW